MSTILQLINEINEKEKVDIFKIVYKFEKKLIKCFKLYENNYGFEDFKMNQVDYLILYTVWKTINILGNIETYLVIIYSYFKLEDFYFPINFFNCNCNSLCNVIQNTDIIKILNNYIYIN